MRAANTRRVGCGRLSSDPRRRPTEAVEPAVELGFGRPCETEPEETPVPIEPVSQANIRPVLLTLDTPAETERWSGV